MTPRDKLIHQNARFYEAFEQGDIDLMEAVWSKADYVKCIHPGWSVLVGWEDIRRSWQGVFTTQSMRFSLRNVVAEVIGDLGIVVLLEEVSQRSGVTLQNVSVAATNIFERDGDAWRLIHHHGSPIAPQREEEDGKFIFN